MDKKTNYSVKTNDKYLKRRLSVLQNKPETFRPTNEVKELLKSQYNKSKYINDALLFYKNRNPLNLLQKYCLRYPITWRRINRRNGLFIKNKIKEMKNA